MELNKSDYQKSGLLKRFPDRPWVSDLIDYAGEVIHHPRYRRYMEMHRQLKEGLNPTPDYNQFTDLLLEMGHHKAAILLPGQSAIRTLVFGRGVCSEGYFGFWGVCMARVMVDYPSPFTDDTVRRLHGLMDRLLFGGAQFATADEVPAIGDWFWRGIASIRDPRLIIHVGVMCNRHYRIQEQLPDERCPVMEGAELGAVSLLTASSAFRNGRKRANEDDTRDAALALTDLFHVDITQLEPPRRVTPPWHMVGPNR